MDRINREKRSANMARIQAKNTAPELIVRKAAHRLGFRFRLHRKDLPGKPDLVFPRLKKIVFVHGCFWHRHEACQFAYMPKSNVSFWHKKFEGNKARDKKNLQLLKAQGWDVLVIWECETGDATNLYDQLGAFLSAAHPS